MASETQASGGAGEEQPRQKSALGLPAVAGEGPLEMRAYFYNKPLKTARNYMEVVMPFCTDFTAVKVVVGPTVMRAYHLAFDCEAGQALLECRKVTVIHQQPGMRDEDYYVPSYLVRPMGESPDLFAEHLEAVLGDGDEGVLMAPAVCWAAWAACDCWANDTTVGLSEADILPPPPPFAEQCGLQLVGSMTFKKTRVGGSKDSASGNKGGMSPYGPDDRHFGIEKEAVKLGVTKTDLKVNVVLALRDSMLSGAKRPCDEMERLNDKRKALRGIKLPGAEMSLRKWVWNEKENRCVSSQTMGKRVSLGELQDGKEFMRAAAKQMYKMLPTEEDDRRLYRQLEALLKANDMKFKCEMGPMEGLKEFVKDLWLEQVDRLLATVGRKDPLLLYLWACEDMLVGFLVRFGKGIGSTNKEIGPWSRVKLNRPTHQAYFEAAEKELDVLTTPHWPWYMERIKGVVQRGLSVFGEMLDEVAEAHQKLEESAARVALFRGVAQGGNQNSGGGGGAPWQPKGGAGGGDGGPRKRPREVDPQHYIPGGFKDNKIRGVGENRRCMHHAKHMIKGAKPCAAGGAGARCKWGHHDFQNPRQAVEFYNTWARGAGAETLTVPTQ